MSAELLFIDAKINLGRRFRLIRKYKGLKQIDFKDLIGLEHKRISEIELGKTNSKLETISKLAFALKVNTLAFWNEAPPEAIPEQLYSNMDDCFRLEKLAFSEKLLSLLLYRGLSQDSLSVLLNVSISEINNFVNANHNITLFSIARLADCLNFNMATFFDYKGPIPENTDFKLLIPRKRKPKKRQ